jgi:hypothetical protein
MAKVVTSTTTEMNTEEHGERTKDMGMGFIFQQKAIHDTKETSIMASSTVKEQCFTQMGMSTQGCENSILKMDSER